MQNDILVKSFVASGAIPANRIVTLAVAANAAALAGATSETLVGISHNTDAADGGFVDVVMAGTPMVKAGASITKGVYLTTNGTGQAVAATDVAHKVIGIALEGAASGDLIPVLLSQS